MRKRTVPSRVSTLAIAIALVAGPSPAAAQSFIGTHNATGATVDQSTPGVTNISVTAPQAVINWTATNNPSGGTIVFQPDGTQANFFSGSDFAVLNRVTPGTAGNAIYMGGNISALAGDFTGGTIFFYSPNGIVIGQNASINVGSLGLTTLPISDDGNGNWMTGFGTANPQVSFGQATDVNSFIRTNAVIDGSINAHGAGSYVALVAPIIQHSGIIRTDTAAALVAAEAATITFSPDGLFDVQVTVGTDAATGIDVDGGTIERRDATEALNNNHYAYLVAVAKNDAVDMLIRNGGSVGFDTATSAALEGNAVVLSGGRNIDNGQTDTATGVGPVNLKIDGATFTTNIEAEINGGADIRTDNGDTIFDSGSILFPTGLNLLAGANSIVTATNGNRLFIAGDLFASLDKIGTATSATGNLLRLSSSGLGSELSVGDDVSLTARVFGVGADEPGVDAVDVTGGTIIVQNGAGSTIDIAGGLSLNVDAFGGNVAGGGATGGSATGGTAQIVANGGSGSGLAVTGPVSISASATGGTVGSDCQASCGVGGGNGTGGSILIQASTISGSQLNLGGTVDLIANGEGGPGDVAAGNGTGGNVQLVSSDGGTISIAGNLTADADGSGGFGMESSGAGGNGGNGTGGFVATLFNGAASTINLNGAFSSFGADGHGGDGWRAGGNATGGWVNLQVGSTGTLNAGFLSGSADAFGGMSDIFGTGSGIAGGTATGGRAWLQASGGGTALISELALDADGDGGDSDSGNGGAGTGGYVIASANNASLTVRGETHVQADGFGGLTGASAGLGGLGTGGQADIFADNVGTVTLTGLVSAEADGQGGHYFSNGATGGNGVGGQVFFQASNGAMLDAATNVTLTANGTGGFSFADCSFCGGTGGDGTGGTVTVQAFGGATTLLRTAGRLDASAVGSGSSGFAGPGGDGQGGTVKLAIQGGTTANFLGDLFLDASGNGGWQINGGTAGNGTGGLVDAFVGASGGILNVDGFAQFDANGTGGNTEGSSGLAGDGLGGTARFLGLGGIASFDGDLIVRATGNGGRAGIEIPSGTGGDGTGRSAQISALGGDINIGGTASVSTNGFGGSGTTGGNGTGGGDYFGGMIDGAHIFARNGDIVIGGAAVAMADGLGGDGADGGNGGDGAGGWTSIHAANGDGGPSSITVQGIEAAAFVSANGVGGDGGDGIAGTDGAGGVTGGNGGTGGTGGNGGTGTGGVAAITAAAGNGTLNIDLGFVDANGTGGAGGTGGVGGAGGFGSNGAGGNGGAGGVGGTGGAAFGGLASTGVESGTTQAAGSNLGQANLAFVEITANAQGGNGGAGGAGGAAGIGSPNGTAGVSGNGGAGGDAVGGLSELQARGGTVDLFSAILTANATGGDGGSGAIAGAGGDAESDEAYVLVTNRIGNTALRGQLTAGTITGVVNATGGTGSTPGASMMEGGSGFYVINADADIGSLDFNVTADSRIADLATDSIVLINADVDVANGFTFNTDGVASVLADNASLNAVSFTMSASNFIHDPARPFPASVGAIGADSFSLTTGQDLVIDAHLISTSSLNLIAPGLIDIEDATSGGDLTLQAGSTIDGGTQTAAGSVLATAPGNITLGNVVAGDLIDIFSSGGDISLAFLSATNSIDLDAAGSIGFGDVTADAFDFSAGGNVNGGDILAGTQATGEAGGAVTLGDINVGLLMSGGSAEDGFAVGIAAAGPITLGNVAADEAIGFATLGNLTTGSLNAGTDVMTLIGGNTSVASIASGGRVYHGDVQMFLAAGGPDNFDPNHPSFAQNPIRSAGSYTVTGAISTGRLQVGAASISTGNITAFNGASLDAAGSVATGAIDAGLLDILAGTNIATGNIFAFDGVTMDAGGSIQTGNIDAGSIDLLAGSDITTGYLNTRLISQLGGGITTLLFPGASITLESGGDISTGNISSKDGVYLDAAGSILTGNIDAFDFVEAHAGTSLATDDIDTGSYVLLNAGTNLSAAAVSASNIDAIAGGTAAVGGAWSAADVFVTSNDIDIGAGGSISAGDIRLTSTNATQTVVGDGVAGGGYQLSDAEYDRLSANDISVIADTAQGAAPKMLLGDLSVDASDGGGVNDYEFLTGDGETETAEGSIRMLGDVVFSNMGESTVGFTTGTFELDAATGLLSLENTPGVLGGGLFLTAGRIHVASGAILDQLAANPQYQGYQEDLNAPATVQRPDGVVRARTIDLELLSVGQGQLNTLYVQNMGTAETPSGFVVSDIDLGDDGQGGLPPNSLDLSINGQIVTDTGTLTGIAVRDLLVQGRDLAPFTANSTINGCLLTGSCTTQGPFPPGFTPLPGLPEEFELVDNSHLPPPDFGNEDFIDDNIETTFEGATSPIKPPQPLFDTSALGEKGDIDDPVSGSGNPALMETAPAPTCPSGGSQPAGQCKQEKQQ